MRRAQKNKSVLKRILFLRFNLVEYLVGTGGWAYFQVPGKPSLKAYSEVF